MGVCGGGGGGGGLWSFEYWENVEGCGGWIEMVVAKIVLDGLTNYLLPYLIPAEQEVQCCEIEYYSQR